MQIELFKQIKKKFGLFSVSTIVFIQLLLPFNQANAFPIYAQQAYTNPREANGRIVCANCHLASKPVELEAPHDPQTTFDSTVPRNSEKGYSSLYVASFSCPSPSI